MVWHMNVYEFTEEFMKVRPNSFSQEGLIALFNYLEEMDENMEFDPIAIDGDYAEYDSLEDAAWDLIGDRDAVEELEENYFTIPFTKYVDGEYVNAVIVEVA